MPLTIPGPQGPAGAAGGDAALDVALLLTQDMLRGGGTSLIDAGPTLNLAHPLFSAIFDADASAFADGAVVIVDDGGAGAGGIYTMAGVASDPGIVTLTRHVDYPDASSPVPQGTRFRVRHSFQQSGWPFQPDNVDAGADTVTVHNMPGWLRIEAGQKGCVFGYAGGAVLPAGLGEGVDFTLVLASTAYELGTTQGYEAVLQFQTGDPPVTVDITDAGSGDGTTGLLFIKGRGSDGTRGTDVVVVGPGATAGALTGNVMERADRSAKGVMSADAETSVYERDPQAGAADVAGVASGGSARAERDAVASGTMARAAAAGIASGRSAFAASSAVALGFGTLALGFGSVAGGSGARAWNMGEVALGGITSLPGPNFPGAFRGHDIFLGVFTDDATPVRAYSATQLGPPDDPGLLPGAFIPRGNVYVFRGVAIAVNAFTQTDMATWLIEGYFAHGADDVAACVATVTRLSHTAGEAAGYVLTIEANATDKRLDAIATGASGVLFSVRLDGGMLETADFWGLSFPAMIPG